MIDLHSHILPGCDDGARSLGESLRMCAMAADDGIAVMAATPHDLNGVYRNGRVTVLAAVAALNEGLASAGVALQVLPGADVHLSADLPGALDRGEVITIADGGRVLLLELPFHFVPGQVRQFVFDLRVRGLVPLITHPERNATLMEDTGVLRAMIEGGALVQITAQSITGGFGSRARKAAYELLECRMAHVVATDAHDTVSRPPVLSRAWRAVERDLGADVARALFIENPGALIEGRVPDVPEPVARGKRSFFSFFGRSRG